MKYCTKCGKELITVAKEGFDETTGKRNTKMVCPTGLCEHTGHCHAYYSSSIWLGMFSDIVVCRKCGKRINISF